MIIKKPEYKTCPECGKEERISGAKYGCDNCKKPIDFNKSPEESEHLSMTIFYHEPDNTKDLHFCSWECVFQKLMTIKMGDFISLPYLSFSVKNQKVGVKGFREAIKKPGAMKTSTEEKVRKLFEWAAEPRTVQECRDFIQSLIKEE